MKVGDPDWTKPKFWKIPLKKLIEGMDNKYDGVKRGFWVISSK